MKHSRSIWVAFLLFLVSTALVLLRILVGPGAAPASAVETASPRQEESTDSEGGFGRPELPQSSSRDIGGGAVEDPARVGGQDNTEATVRAVVVDDRNQAIPGARLRHCRPRHGVIGTTTADDSGRATIEEPLLVGDHVYADAAGHGTGEPDDYSARPLHIHLSPAGEIQGEVTACTGESPDGRLQVIAVPSQDERLLWSAGQDSLLDHPGVVLAQVDENGRFTLPGLSSRSSYVLAAGGNGWTCGELEYADCGDHVAMEVTAAFAVRMRFLSEGKVCRLPRYGGAGSLVSRLADPESRFARLPTAILRLAGAPSDFDLDEVGCVAILKCGNDLQAGPLSIQADPPGFESVFAECYPARVGREGLDQDFVLRAKVGGTGVLVVQGLEAYELPSLNKPIGHIELTGADGGNKYTYFLSGADPEQVIQFVPVGAYTASVVVLPGASPCYEATVEITSSDTAHLRIPPPESAVELDLVSAGGQAEDEPIWFMLGQRVEDETRFSRSGPFRSRASIVFDRAPYVIRGLAPGVYDCIANELGGPPDQRATRRFLMPVEESASRRITVQLKARR